MSAKIALENISVGVSQNSRAAPRPVPTSRPIENAGASSADSQSSENKAFGRKISDGNKAQPGTRPPGKDPSVLPQSLFDAALISSEYKPKTEPTPPLEAAAEELTGAQVATTQTKTEQSDARQESASAASKDTGQTSGQSSSNQSAPVAQSTTTTQNANSGSSDDSVTHFQIAV